MATNNEENTRSKKGGSSVFGFAAAALAAITAINMILVYILFSRSWTTYNTTSDSMKYINSVNSELLSVNRNVLMVVAGIYDDPTAVVTDITVSFDNIESDMKKYEKLGNHSTLELRRYNQAKTFINTYHQKLLDLQNSYTGFDASTMRNLYIQEIHPLQITASEMFNATIDIATNETQKEMDSINRLFYIIEGVMVGLLVLGEIAIIVIAKIVKANRIALEKKTRQAEAAANKFKHSQQKMSDIAYTNIRTNLKNRYALDADITDKLDSEQMYIAAFDFDNFRSINDTYGYDFGDEYLAQVAEKLKNDFSQYAEIYNITGNEFCFVFNPDVSDASVRQLVNNILLTMSSSFNIANLVVQLTASGSVYHYQPGDCLNTSALLVKMDSVLRNVKRNGGNAIYEVNVY